MAHPSLRNDPRNRTQPNQQASSSQAGPSTSAGLNAGMQRLSVASSSGVAYAANYTRLDPLASSAYLGIEILGAGSRNTSNSSSKSEQPIETLFATCWNDLPKWLRNPRDYLKTQDQKDVYLVCKSDQRRTEFVTKVFIESQIVELTKKLLRKSDGQYSLSRKKGLAGVMPFHLLKHLVMLEVVKHAKFRKTPQGIENDCHLYRFYMNMSGKNSEGKKIDDFNPTRTMQEIESFLNDQFAIRAEGINEAWLKIFNMVSTLLMKSMLQMTCNHQLITAADNTLLNNQSAKFMIASLLDFSSIVNDIGEESTFNLPKLFSVFVDMHQRLYRILLGSELIKLNALLKSNKQVLHTDVDKSFRMQGKDCLLDAFQQTYNQTELTFKKYVAELKTTQTDAEIIEKLKPENMAKILADLNDKLTGLSQATTAIKLLVKIVDDKIDNQIPVNATVKLKYINNLKQSHQITADNIQIYQPLLDLIDRKDLLVPVRECNANFLEEKEKYGLLAGWIRTLNGNQSASIGISAVSAVASHGWGIV